MAHEVPEQVAIVAVTLLAAAASLVVVAAVMFAEIAFFEVGTRHNNRIVFDCNIRRSGR